MAGTNRLTTVSTKGQVILPKAIRDRLQWDAGTRLIVEHTDAGVLLRRLTDDFAPTRPEDVFACLAYQGPAKSLADMEAPWAPKPGAGMRAIDTNIIVRF